MLIYEYYNAELLQNTALKIADTVGLLTPPDGQAFGVLSALTNLETVSSTLIENYSAVRVHTLDISVPTEDAVQAYIQDIIEHDVPSIDKIIIKSATIPTASADLLGSVYQYVGQTDGTYQHGYIYECVAGDPSYTGIIGIEPTKIAFDYTRGDIVAFFREITPNFAQITHGTFTYDIAGNIWTIEGKDANENVIFDNYRLYTEDLEDAGFVFINPPADYHDGDVFDYYVTFTETTTYNWERIDVQPNSEAEIAELQAEVAEIQSVIPAQASASNQLADKAYVQTGLDSKQDNLTATDGLTLNNNVISGKTLQDDIADINTLIPNQATAQNQLADKNYVQSGLDGKQNISTNDYQMGNASGRWTTMTTAQQNALNSGATTTKINAIATNTQAIADEVARATGAESALSERITANTNNFANYRTAAAQDAIDATLATKTELGNETTARESADNGLQTQIDAIVSKSDVVDIVGTYAELQAYDTSALGNNDVVKVISDSTHNNAPSFYRWVITGGVGAWVYIGSESVSYTKAETDALLNEKQDTLTTAQQAAVDSGITTAKRTAYDNHLTNTNNPHSVTKAQVGLSNVDNTSDLNKPISTATQEALDDKQNTISDLATIRSGAALGATAVQPADLATVATTGDYGDLLNKPTIPAAQVNSDWNANSGVAQILNKPTIPTVNNPTITITQGGVTKGSFTLNQATGDTIALDAGGGVGNIDNITITTNSDSEIQAVAVIDQNTGIAKTWTGTMAEYEAIVTKDPETEYIITDDIGGSATEIGQITEALNDKVDKGHQVIAFQAPTAANNYTWYRKYADGWVEQGGYTTIPAAKYIDITLPIPMQDNHYTPMITASWSSSATGQNEGCDSAYKTNTTMRLTASFASVVMWWQVSGMAA